MEKTTGTAIIPELSKNALTVLARRYLKRDKEGNEILVPDKDNVYVLGGTAGGDRTVSMQQKVKLVDDQTPDIPQIFADFKRKEGIPW